MSTLPGNYSKILKSYVAEQKEKQKRKEKNKFDDLWVKCYGWEK